MDPRVKDAVAFIGEHLQSRITVNEVAAASGLSVSQFTRLFRRDTGTTPSTFVSQRRMERAALLLERTDLSVTEVMNQVGVTDPSHFARDFRRTHGFGPRTFRQHLRHTTRPLVWSAAAGRRVSHTNNQEDESSMIKSPRYDPAAARWPREPETRGSRPANDASAATADRRSGQSDRRRFSRTDRRRST